MPITLDIIDEGELDIQQAGSQYTRGGVAYGLDAGLNAGDPSMLFRALVQAGMPQRFDAHPSDSNFICNRVVVRPLSDSMARVLIYYVAGPITPLASQWVVTDSTSLTQTTTQIHPGTNEPLDVDWEDPLDEVDNRVKDTVTMSYLMPLRQLTYEGFVTRSQLPGTTPTGPAHTDRFAELQGTVNESPWHGYPRGFWQCVGFWSQSQDRGQSYTIRATFASKVREDWAQYAVLRDTNTGKYVQVDPRDIAILKSAQYEWGINRGNGILKAGMYEPVDFASIFGP